MPDIYIIALTTDAYIWTIYHINKLINFMCTSIILCIPTYQRYLFKIDTDTGQQYLA